MGATVVVEKNLEVPMRDGVVLAADVYRPAGGQPAPTLVTRTPYGKEFTHYISAGCFSLPLKLAEDGYAVVVNDVRGRFGSAGEFTPYVHDAADGFDTVEWSSQQSWSNGEIGIFGCSYLGLTNLLAAREAPPSLRCAIAMVAPANPFLEMSNGSRLPWLLAQAVINLHRPNHGVPEKSQQALFDAFADESYRRPWRPLATAPGISAPGVAPYFQEMLLLHDRLAATRLPMVIAMTRTTRSHVSAARAFRSSCRVRRITSGSSSATTCFATPPRRSRSPSPSPGRFKSSCGQRRTVRIRTGSRSCWAAGRDRALIEITKDGNVDEPGSRHQVLELVAMKPAHGELDFLGREQRTRASALVAQRDRLNLPRTITYDAEEPGHGIRLVLEFELLMPGLLIDSHAFEARVEDVESDRASGPQVAADALEAGELIADVFEVLEGAERGEYQREWFTGKLEVRSNAPSRRRSRGRGLPVPTRRSYPWCSEIPEGDRACKGTARNSCASLSDAVIYTAWCLGDNEGLES